MHVCLLYTWIFINITCSDHIMLLLCVFSGMTVEYWITNWCALLGDDYPSHSQLSSVAYSSLCRAEALWAFPHLLGHVHWCISYSAHIWALHQWDFMGQERFHYYLETQSCSTRGNRSWYCKPSKLLDASEVVTVIGGESTAVAQIIRSPSRQRPRYIWC